MGKKMENQSHCCRKSDEWTISREIQCDGTQGVTVQCRVPASSYCPSSCGAPLWSMLREPALTPILSSSCVVSIEGHL